jgi:rhamnose transport system ATP-binding protein
MAEAVLRAEGIVKRFGATTALDGANFEIGKGEVVGLVGANGAGKSSLVKVLSGALQPDDGEIQIGGEARHGLTPRLAQRLGIATIYQEPSLVPTLGLAENIVLGREPTHGPGVLARRSERTSARECLVKVGLADRLGLTAGDLSPAGQQMLEIAKALHRDSRVVIMDEPTAALGETESQRLFEVIHSLTDAGVGVIYISHRLDEVLELSDRIVVMRDGRTVFSGAAAGQDETTLVRQMIGHDVAKIGAQARERGEVVLSVRGLGQGTRIRDINFEIHRGEVLGITGLVGSGRSRLGRLIFGAERADQGEMRLLGKPYRPHSPHAAIRRGVGFVPEDRKRDALLLDLAAAKNVTLASPVSRLGLLRPRAERRIAMKWIERLAVKPRSAVALPRFLSGGNQQKLVIARWLHTDAQLLILDEPGQGVDIDARAQILRALRELAAKGRAVIVISQELDELEEVADRVLIMRRGAIAGELSVDELDEERVLSLAMVTQEKAETTKGAS